MGVLRVGKTDGFTQGQGAGRNGAMSGITVKCPKCQAPVVIAGFRNDEPVRCSKCAYPMVSRADLMQIVAACKKPNSADQVNAAVIILERLADFIPEAGTALGELSSQYTLPISDWERWNKLYSAYSGGDERAREWLDRMCQSNPGVYGQKTCSRCGAQKYYIKRQGSGSVCIYCQCAD